MGRNYDKYMVPWPWEAEDMVWRSWEVCADRRSWRRERDILVIQMGG